MFGVHRGYLLTNGVSIMRAREQLADIVAGQSGRQQRKQFVRSLKETAARAVVTASVTFAVGWVLKKMFETSVAEAAKEGAAEGTQEDPSEQRAANFETGLSLNKDSTARAPN